MSSHPFEGIGRALPPLDQIGRAKLMKVSRVGQVTIPAPVLRRWGYQSIGGGTDAYDAQSLLIIAKQPVSEQLELKVEDPDTTVRELGNYAISTAGQITMPAVFRHRWGLMNGGRILFADLHDQVVFMQPETMRQMAEDFMPRDALVEAIGQR
ncbi:MAG: hypothetical protein ACXWLH_01045 [Candidatus Saccharimonadales bacterium]